MTESNSQLDNSEKGTTLLKRLQNIIVGPNLTEIQNKFISLNNLYKESFNDLEKSINDKLDKLTGDHLKNINHIEKDLSEGLGQLEIDHSSKINNLDSDLSNKINKLGKKIDTELSNRDKTIKELEKRILHLGNSIPKIQKEYFNQIDSLTEKMLKLNDQLDKQTQKSITGINNNIQSEIKKLESSKMNSELLMPFIKEYISNYPEILSNLKKKEK